MHLETQRGLIAAGVAGSVLKRGASGFKSGRAQRRALEAIARKQAKAEGKKVSDSTTSME